LQNQQLAILTGEESNFDDVNLIEGFDDPDPNE
jgi:hypothetical protein